MWFPKWADLWPVFHFIPKLCIFALCAFYFALNVTHLFVSFVHYEMNVMVKYDLPSRMRFPAFTVCGCCLLQTVANQSLLSIAEHEQSVLVNRPVREVIESSVRVDQLLRHCYYVANSNRPSEKTQCEHMQSVQESLYDGRKCFTFFTQVTDSEHRKPAVVMADLENSERSTSYLYLEFEFDARQVEEGFEADTIQNSDIILAVHPASMLATLLDVEFIRIDPLQMYEIQFSADYTRLLPPPYRTRCAHYSARRRPRSYNECLNLCIAERLLLDYHYRCVNYYSLVTAGIFQYLVEKYPHLVDNQTDLCFNRGYHAYLDLVEARRHCAGQGCARDCLEEDMKVTYDVSLISDHTTRSIVVISPNFELSQTVTYEPEMNTTEFIGYIGGHAHIWLGLSAIQFYNVLVGVVGRVWRWARGGRFRVSFSIRNRSHSS